MESIDVPENTILCGLPVADLYMHVRSAVFNDAYDKPAEVQRYNLFLHIGDDVERVASQTCICKTEPKAEWQECQRFRVKKSTQVEKGITLGSEVSAEAIPGDNNDYVDVRWVRNAGGINTLKFPLKVQRTGCLTHEGNCPCPVGKNYTPQEVPPSMDPLVTPDPAKCDCKDHWVTTWEVVHQNLQIPKVMRLKTGAKVKGRCLCKDEGPMVEIYPGWAGVLKWKPILIRREDNLVLHEDCRLYEAVSFGQKAVSFGGKRGGGIKYWSGWIVDYFPPAATRICGVRFDGYINLHGVMSEGADESELPPTSKTHDQFVSFQNMDETSEKCQCRRKQKKQETCGCKRAVDCNK